MRGSDLVRIARWQCGTRWRHQGRIPYRALDCWGLIIVSAAIGGLNVPDVPGYGPEPMPEQFMVAVRERAEQAQRLDGPRPGDGLVIAWAQNVPQHLAIASGMGTLIHCAARAGLRRVVEEPIDEAWQRRIHSIWRLRGLEDG